jgi:hypothetical protein
MAEMSPDRNMATARCLHGRHRMDQTISLDDEEA